MNKKHLLARKFLSWLDCLSWKSYQKSLGRRMWVYTEMMDFCYYEGPVVVVETKRENNVLHRLFEPLGLKITIAVCHQTVNLLDNTLNLTNGSYQPYRKPSNDPLYINSNSNHPPSIIKQLPISINKRLFTSHPTGNPSNRVQRCMRTRLIAVITNRSYITLRLKNRKENPIKNDQET